MARNRQKKGHRTKNTEHPSDTPPLVSSGNKKKGHVVSVTEKQFEVLELIKKKLSFMEIHRAIKKAKSTTKDRINQLIKKGLVINQNGTYRLTSSGKMATSKSSGGSAVVYPKNVHSNEFTLDIKRLPNHYYQGQFYFQSLRKCKYFRNERAKQSHLEFSDCSITIYETKLRITFWIKVDSGRSYDHMKSIAFDKFVDYYEMLINHGFSLDNRIRSETDPHFADPNGFFAKLASYSNSESFKIETDMGPFWIDYSQGENIPEEETDKEEMARRMEQISRSAFESKSDFVTIDKLIEWAKYQSLTTHNMINNCQGIKVPEEKQTKTSPSYIG